MSKKPNEMLKEPDWALRIVKAQNGFVLESELVLDNDTLRTERSIVEETEVRGEIGAAIDMLYAVLNFFGVHGIKIEDIRTGDDGGDHAY